VRILLDTHAAVWAVSRPEKIPKAIKTLIEDGENSVWVSIVSIWEIAIKQALTRASAPEILAENAIEDFRDAGFELLHLKVEHTIAVASLHRKNHGDPFDRMLVAQALHEPLRLVTHDSALANYDPTIITF
jgi:PIN domain nuclease of toxin-antitoxin system